MSELKRCGCGGEAKVNRWKWETNRPKERYDVYCNVCGISTVFYPTEAEVITAWNLAMGAERCCNTCDSYEDGRYCKLWSIFCKSDHWCKDWSNK